MEGLAGYELAQITKKRIFSVTTYKKVRWTVGGDSNVGQSGETMYACSRHSSVDSRRKSSI